MPWHDRSCGDALALVHQEDGRELLNHQLRTCTCGLGQLT
jgi:hypothetical protein